METPSSLRRQTRSQARKGRQEEAPERSALLDITNDSPVVGLKVGGFAEKAATLPAAKAKAAAAAVRTPGSGEALLRKQVKFLLQKVEEESELVVGVPPPPTTTHGEQCCPAFRALISHLRSPAQLLAPTPANTPVLKEEDAAVCETVLLHLGRHEVEFRSAMEDDAFEQKPSDHHVDGAMISRALQFDSPQKTETTCNSPDGSCSSAWSLQVNCSSKLEEDDDEDGGEEDEVEEVGYYVGEDEDEEEEEEEEEEEDEWFDVLCEVMKKVSLLEEAAAGKHTRFVYDSDDDEITGEEEVTRGTGMPVPQGKHIRFQEEEEDEEEA